MTLKDLRIGESAKITAVGGEGALRQHFLDMGVGRGNQADEAGADGRSDGVSNPWL